MSDNTWQACYAQVQSLLDPGVDFNRYFDSKTTMPGGERVAHLSLGNVSLPKGQVIVCDPLTYLDWARPYQQTVPAGTYAVECCVRPQSETDSARYMAVRVRFSAAEAVRFENALVGDEELCDMEAGDFFGFAVDAGLACICDAETHQAALAFVQTWYAENPDGNIYDDYFAGLFAESCRSAPAHQREGGDWLNWTVPGSEWQIPMFQSGYGDGSYPVYWGFDAAGRVCQLVIQFIDVEEEDDDTA